jgi:hypothetical protein
LRRLIALRFHEFGIDFDTLDLKGMRDGLAFKVCPGTLHGNMTRPIPKEKMQDESRPPRQVISSVPTHRGWPMALAS